MKKVRIEMPLVLLLIFSIIPMRGAVHFQDDFNDSIVDLGSWEVRLPFSGAFVNEAGGTFNFLNGGQALTLAGFVPPYEVNARVSLAGNPYGMLIIVIRTTGTKHPNSPSEFFDGIRFQIAKAQDSGPGNSFHVQDPQGMTLQATRDFELGQFYDLKIIDTGTTFSLFFDDMTTPVLTGTSLEASGQGIGFYNRPGAAGGSSISEGGEFHFDFFKVQDYLPGNSILDSDGDGLSDEYEMGRTRYQVIALPNSSWKEASQDAINRGGHLATVTSQVEWDQIVSLFGSELLFCYLGGTDEGTEGVWRWVTGEPWNFSYWNSGQPSNSSGVQHFLWLHGAYGLRWDDTHLEDISGGKYLLEMGYYSDPMNPDTDGDGLSDFEEVTKYGTFPNFADSDGDGISDKDELLPPEPTCLELLSEAQAELEKAKLQISDLSAQLGKANDQISNQQLAIAQLRIDIASLKTQNETLQANFSLAQATITELTSQLASAKAKIEAQMAEIATLKGRVAELSGENTELRERLLEANAKIAAQSDEIAAAKSLIAAQESAIQSLETKLTALSNENTDLRQQLENCERVRQQLTKQNEIFENRLNRMTDLIQKLEADFRVTFKDADFIIKGENVDEKLTFLVDALLNLNRGRKLDIYKQLDR
jgi:predicted  nucleic acid-binding Zn-ribbon protein